jgi:FkbM family methyltransferase
MKTFSEEIELIKAQCNSGAVRSKTETLAKEFNKKPVILYGAGTLSIFVLDHLERYGIKVEAFADTFRSGTHENGLPIITAEQLKNNYGDAITIVTSELHGASILNTLKKIEYTGKIYTFDELLGFYVREFSEFEPILGGYEWAYDFFEDEISKKIVIDSLKTRLLGTHMTPSVNPQYFEPDIFELAEDEIFVDGGCFVGDTAEEYIHNKYKKIYGFEPDKNNLKKAIANLAQYENIELFNGGLFNITNKVRFMSGQFGGSKFADEGETLVDSFSLDEFFADKEPPTFIKMDIEGAEPMALEGARNLLITNSPKLAICVYHSPTHIYEIPQKIISINQEYKLFLRHYSHWYAETVCYSRLT